MHDYGLSVDRFTVEVLKNAFASIVDEMGVLVAHSGMSPVITQGRDFGGAVLTREGELVMLGRDALPAYAGAMSFTAGIVLSDFGDDIHEGDVFVTNDTHRAGTHLPDFRMVKPIFSSGEFFAFLITCGHLSDVGGSVAGSFVANAQDCFTEGVLIPPLRLVTAGFFNEDVLRLLTANTRLPEINKADLLALLASLELGERRLADLIHKYGRDVVLAMFEQHIASAGEEMRQLVDNLPDGEYSMVDHVDFDPGTDSAEPLECRLALRIAGQDAVFDFSATDASAKGAINAPLATTTSAVICALKGVFPELELCGGLNRAVRIETTPGSLFHALWPAPTSGVSGAGFQKAVDLCFGCLAQIVPDRVMACPYTEMNYVQAGDDPRSDSLYDEYILYTWSEGGYGARKEQDNGTFITFFSGGSMNQSVELYEQLYPILWEKTELITDSGGAGRRRGGLGDVRRVRLRYGQAATLSSFGDRERFPPWGLYGGKPGGNQGFVVNPGTPDEVSLGVMNSGHKVKNGDFWDYWSAGGGGFGDPLEREPGLVLEDVKDDFVSVEGARRDYGVVIVPGGLNWDTWQIDRTATDELRAELRAEAHAIGSDGESLQ